MEHISLVNIAWFVAGMIVISTGLLTQQAVALSIMIKDNLAQAGVNVDTTYKVVKFTGLKDMVNILISTVAIIATVWFFNYTLGGIIATVVALTLIITFISVERTLKLSSFYKEVMF